MNVGYTEELVALEREAMIRLIENDAQYAVLRAEMVAELGEAWVDAVERGANKP